MANKRHLQRAIRFVRAIQRGPNFALTDAEHSIENPTPLNYPIFNFTIDFELIWENAKCGDSTLKWEDRIRHAKTVREAFSPFLNMIQSLNFPLSWAVVGILIDNDLFRTLSPEQKFVPKWSQQDWYATSPDLKDKAYLCEARDLILAIKETKQGPQEFLSHGYAHIDYADPSVTKTIAQADAKLGVQALRSMEVSPQGFAFPCNQLAHLDVIQDQGFSIVRGSTNEWNLSSHRPIVTPKGFWISPAQFHWREVTSIIEKAIQSRSFIHPWMHLVECTQVQYDIDQFFKPIFEFVLEQEDKGNLKIQSFRQIADSIHAQSKKQAS